MRLLGLGTYVETRHDDHDDVVGRGEIDIVHDQSLVVNETRLGVDYGVNAWLSASLLVPIRVVQTEITYLDMAGTEVELVRDGIHHRDERVSGLGDPMVMAAASGTTRGVMWSVRGGVTVPLGRTEEDPFALGDMDLAHQHIQLGTGTVNPVLGADVGKRWGAWRLGGFAFTQQVVYENGKGYQAGDRYAGGVTLRRALGSRGQWGVRGGAEVQAETAERWGGVVPTDDGNRGRFDALVGAGASWASTSGLTVDLAVKVPVVTHVVGGQLDMPAIMELGVSWRFGASPAAAAEGDEHAHDHDHDHEHGDEHDHGDDEHGDDEHGDEHALDILDVGAPGEAVELVPVPGKVTIFDFWATWCEPCKTLEPALVELARRYPDKVAIRRIDAHDWDSPAVARYLTPGGFNLPHVKVFDPSGTMVLEQGSAPGKLDELIEAVRNVVEAHASPAAAQ